MKNSIPTRSEHEKEQKRVADERARKIAELADRDSRLKSLLDDAVGPTLRKLAEELKSAKLNLNSKGMPQMFGGTRAQAGFQLESPQGSSSVYVFSINDTEMVRVVGNPQRIETSCLLSLFTKITEQDIVGAVKASIRELTDERR